MVLKLVNVVIVGVDRGFIFMILRKKHGGLQEENVVKETGKKVEPTVLFADIIDIETDKIFDLRAYKDLCDFEEKITPLLGEYSFELSGMNETEKIIQLRSLFISYYAEKNDKKLIIGNFRQRPQPMYEHAIEFSNSLDMIFGIETIYCVKDSNIIENIH